MLHIVGTDPRILNIGPRQAATFMHKN